MLEALLMEAAAFTLNVGDQLHTLMFVISAMPPAQTNLFSKKVHSATFNIHMHDTVDIAVQVRVEW